MQILEAIEFEVQVVSTEISASAMLVSIQKLANIVGKYSPDAQVRMEGSNSGAVTIMAIFEPQTVPPTANFAGWLADCGIPGHLRRFEAAVVVESDDA